MQIGQYDYLCRNQIVHVGIFKCDYCGHGFDRLLSQLRSQTLQYYNSSCKNYDRKGKVTLETRQRLSTSLKGKKRTQETRKRMSVSRVKMLKTTDMRKRISAALKGKHLSPEHRKSLRDNHKGMSGKKTFVRDTHKDV